VPCVALLGLYVMKEKTIAFKENSTWRCFSLPVGSSKS
jgi:hypothetical protein